MVNTSNSAHIGPLDEKCNDQHVHYVPPTPAEQQHNSTWAGTLHLPQDTEKGANANVHANVRPADMLEPLSRRRSSLGLRITPTASRSSVGGRRRSSYGIRRDSKVMTEEERQEYLEATVEHGENKYKRLGWLQLVVVLIVEAIALGSLSLPKAFATLGMVAGVIICVAIGFIAIYTSYVVGQVKLKYPQVQHYSDIGPLLIAGRGGRILQDFIGSCFVVYLVLLVGSHCLTGSIAFVTISESNLCKLVWGIISMILLFICALPPSFAEMAVLGYIDFVSICIAILLTLIAAGVQSSRSVGLSNVDWSAWPRQGTTFYQAMVSVTDVLFAYSFAICQFSFMSEMHTPADFPKSIWTLGIVEIIIYTCTGAIGYALIGQEVKSPALLSAGHTVSRIAFGIALPVIFISGSINTVTAGRYIMDRYFSKSTIKYVNTPAGWGVWILMIALMSVIAWVVAEAIPFFSDLLSIISSLFISGFTFYLPGIMWLALIREGGYFHGAKNTTLTCLNAFCVAIGIFCLVCGTYGAVMDIKESFKEHTVGGSFSCKTT